MLAGMHRRLLALSVVLACNPADTPEAGESEESSGGASSGAGEAEYTYYRDVAPILASKCTSCHSAGNIAPFALESAAEARMWAPALAAAVMQGTMPPWPPDPACNSYAHDRSLSDEQRAAIVGWAEAGAPEGDASDAAPAPEPPPAIDYDMQLQLPVAYTPTIAPDEYRWTDGALRFFQDDYSGALAQFQAMRDPEPAACLAAAAAGAVMAAIAHGRGELGGMVAGFLTLGGIVLGITELVLPDLSRVRRDPTPTRHPYGL